MHDAAKICPKCNKTSDLQVTYCTHCFYHPDYPNEPYWEMHNRVTRMTQMFRRLDKAIQSIKNNPSDMIISEDNGVYVFGNSEYKITLESVSKSTEDVVTMDFLAGEFHKNLENQKEFVDAVMAVLADHKDALEQLGTRIEEIHKRVCKLEHDNDTKLELFIKDVDKRIRSIQDELRMRDQATNVRIDNHRKEIDQLSYLYGNVTNSVDKITTWANGVRSSFSLPPDKDVK